ncbi:conserved unknown protein [Ectocarpus siliculosus]|uniref:Ubiquitin-like protease family profile domain-containing protein n=1 Tax=Ectocarpus siliculosus TaxID=2880 RepID=D8LLK8_ECTSI|nr:conserved unknown protein [Ectocarpus siliculosus]|eukprot:CBN74639.1 conserved unknown protein [Ectocarpus siliculosus]
MTQVLNYHDAVVYDTDVALFGDGEWLNDNCINWFFRVLEHEVFPGRTDLLFMDPAVVSCMMNQCDDLEEYEDLGRGLELAIRSMVFVPVNNAAGPFSRGSHWSLLVCDRRIAGGDERRSRWRFRHFDSSEGSNRTPAELTAAKFVKMLGEKTVGEDKPSRVEHVREAPQQRNAFDCGMYTILLAERLASKAAAATAAASQQSSTTPTPPVVASAVTGVPRCNVNPRQDSEAAPAGKGGEAGTGGDAGSGGGLCSVDSFGRDKTSVAVEENGSGEGSRAVETMAMSPTFVSSARTLARERLSRCIENQRRC